MNTLRFFSLLTASFLSFFATHANAQSSSDQSYGWTYTVGDSAYDQVNDVAVDGKNNSYTVGQFGGAPDFDPGRSVHRMYSQGGEWDAFLSILTPSGKFLKSFSIGGPGAEDYRAIDIDKKGNILIAGTVTSPDFEPGYIADLDPTGHGDYHMTVGNTDFFVTKLNANGSYAWSRMIGGPSYEMVRAIRGDSHGNIYVTGSFMHTVDFDPGPEIDNHTAPCMPDYCMGNTFITSFDAEGNYRWTRSFGALGDDTGNSIAIDSQGVVIVGGFKDVGSNYVPGVGSVADRGDLDGFIARLDSNGNYLSFWVLGGTSRDMVRGVVVQGNEILATGLFSSTVDFDPRSSIQSRSSVGGFDAFVARYTAAGAPIFIDTMGGIGDDWGKDVALDKAGNAIVGGAFDATIDFDPSSRIVSSTSVGDKDLFVATYSPTGKYIRHATIGSGSWEEAVCLAVGTDSAPLVGGFFTRTMDFDPTSGFDIRDPVGPIDGYVVDGFISRYN